MSKVLRTCMVFHCISCERRNCTLIKLNKYNDGPDIRICTECLVKINQIGSVTMKNGDRLEKSKDGPLTHVPKKVDPPADISLAEVETEAKDG